MAPTARERINYDRKILHDALKRRYPRGAAEIAELVGKSRSWVGDVIRENTDNSKTFAVPTMADLKLLCALAGLEVEDILLENEPEAPAPVPAPTPIVQTQPIVINQNIMLTDDQFEWVKDAYQQLRADEKRRHEEVLTQISDIGRLLVELLNTAKKGFNEA